MDISDDLCRADFFDLVPMGLDPKFGDASAHSLTPVALIDSSDYMQADGNNNLISGATGHIKSFLDEMFLNDSLNGDPSQALTGSTFEVLGTFQWSADGTATNSTTSSGDDDSPPGDPSSWLLNPGFNSDGEVTTLTNLIDPLFVTYEDENGGSVTTKIEQYLGGGEHRAVSSDLITSTFIHEPSSNGDHSPTEVSSQSSNEGDLISWQKSSDGIIGGGNSLLYCDDSLLRSALQSGNNNNNNSNNNNNLNGTKVVKLTAVVSASSVATNNEMTELRKVLSFPPLTSPTSSTPDGQPLSQSSSEVQHPYSYELKVIDPNFDPSVDNIPDVEELIMTRIDPSFGGYQQQTIIKDHNNNKKKLGEISERKINSTTLSTKWTYTTTNEQGKTPRRRSKKNNNGLKKTLQGGGGGMNENGLTSDPYSPTNKSNSSSSGGSPNSHQSSGTGTGGNGIRKERSLHYCNICCKGFKDKYSVNVHVRTHTGEKPFSCNLCGKNFRQKAHLAKHYQTHAAKNGREANNQHKSSSKR